jgi:hypothetical protein
MSSFEITFQQDLWDYDRLAELEANSMEQKERKKPFPDAVKKLFVYTSKQVIESAHKQGAHVITASLGNKMVGYLIHDDQGDIRIYTLPVQPPQRVGKMLLREFICKTSALNALSLSSETGAIEAHKKNGFILSPTEDDDDYMVMPPENIAKWRQSTGGTFPTFS